MKQLKRFGVILLIISLCLTCFVGCDGEYAGWVDDSVAELQFKRPKKWENSNDSEEIKTFFIDSFEDNVLISVGLQEPQYADKEAYWENYLQRKFSDKITFLDNEEVGGQETIHYQWDIFYREDCYLEGYLLDTPSGVIIIQSQYPADLSENPVEKEFRKLLKSVKIDE